MKEIVYIQLEFKLQLENLSWHVTYKNPAKYMYPPSESITHKLQIELNEKCYQGEDTVKNTPTADISQEKF